MRKRMYTAAFAAALTVGAAMTAYAGQWIADGGSWWYQEDDGSWPASTWKWIDGNGDGISECYYFDANGYMAASTATPDGYTVDGSGAWVVDGVVQTQAASGSNQTAQTSEQSMPEKYPLKTTAVKEKYVNLLNKGVDELFRVMGETEGNEVSGITQYVYSIYVKRTKTNEPVIFEVSDGKVFAVKINPYDYNLSLLNEDQLDMAPDDTAYSTHTIDNAMGGGQYINANGDFAWKISDEYPIYYIQSFRARNRNMAAILLYQEEANELIAPDPRPHKYYADNNPYLDYSAYQIMRDEIFTDLQNGINSGRLNPASTGTLSYYAKSKTIVFSDNERDLCYDMEKWIAYEVSDYLLDTYGWQTASIVTTRLMASNNLSGSDWNPCLNISVKYQGGNAQ